MNPESARRLPEEAPRLSSLPSIVEPESLEYEAAALEESVVASHASQAKTGNVHADVWRMAWPSVLTFSLMTTNMILDRVFVGSLGPNALAAVGVGGQLLFLLVSLSMAISVGTTALVARFTGASEPGEIARATGQSLALGTLLGLVSTVLAYAGLPALLSMMRLTPEAEADCRRFLGTALLSTPPMFVATVLSSAFRGLGDTRTPLKVMLWANGCHILGDLTLMLGKFGAPKLGLAGGGVAITVSNLVAAAAYLWLMRDTILASSVTSKNLRLTWEWVVRLMRIGIPAAFTALLRVTSLMGFTSVLARTAEHTFAVAALPIGMTAESIAFMPGFGFSVAASALVGQSLGAGDPERASRYGWAANAQAVAIMTVMGAIFFLAAEPFARLFTHDPHVVPLAVSYLRIMALSEPLLGCGMVLTGALQGAGETVQPTIVTAVAFWVVRLPLAWLLALKLAHNASGAWIAMATTTCFAGIWTILLFRSGRWKSKRV
jgi:putative MATE family efflux protein